MGLAAKMKLPGTDYSGFGEILSVRFLIWGESGHKYALKMPPRAANSSALTEGKPPENGKICIKNRPVYKKFTIKKTL
jgi:hypothetical protein